MGIVFILQIYEWVWLSCWEIIWIGVLFNLQRHHVPNSTLSNSPTPVDTYEQKKNHSLRLRYRNASMLNQYIQFDWSLTSMMITSENVRTTIMVKLEQPCCVYQVICLVKITNNLSPSSGIGSLSLCWLSCLGSGIGSLSGCWLSCLGSFGFLATKTFKLFSFPVFWCWVYLLKGGSKNMLCILC